MKNGIIYLSIVFFCSLILACGGNGGSANVEPVQIGDYELTRIPGTSVDKAIKLHETGVVMEEGYLLDGKKFGQWITFNPKDGKVTSITNYVNDAIDGLYLKFSNREQVDMKTSYRQNNLHGKYAELNFGRPTKEANYVDGQLDGLYKEFYSNGKLLKEIEFKEGKQDGIYRYYDEKGNVTIEYQYKDGEKVSGGLVN